MANRVIALVEHPAKQAAVPADVVALRPTA
jgi:hypothetical protein